MDEISDASFGPTLPRNVLDTLFDTELRIRRASATHMGHPYNLQPLPRVPPTMASLLINNLGDPHSGSSFAGEVCDLERQVIDWLAQVWGSPHPDQHAGTIWASGTEANLRAIHLGREAHPGAVLLHGADAHASIPQAAHLLRLETRQISSTPAGEIDLTALDTALRDLRDRPVILALTCGTTMTGAQDDIAGAIRLLDDAGIGQDRRFIHVDGALGAMVLPFLPAAPPRLRPDFGLGIDSISTSGHLMIGTPMPCSALIRRRAHLDRTPPAATSRAADDTASAGSRNGHAVVAMWTRLMTQGVAGFAKDAMRCTLRAADLAAALRSIGVEVLLNPHSLTVVFPEPDAQIVATYQLACQEGKAHAIIMPSVSDALIDRFTAAYCDWFRTAHPPD